VKRLVLAAVAVAILGVANFAAAGSNRYWDPSPAGQSLDPQTRAVLGRVGHPLRVTMFARDDASAQRRLLERYRLAQSKISLRFVDPDAQPSVAQQYKLQAYGTVVVEYEKRRENALSPTEQEITGAIVRVLRTQHNLVCFTAGHGESDIAATVGDGLSAWARALADNGVETKTVTLSDPANLDPCRAVVLVPATGDLSPGETAAIQRLTDRGGGVLVGLAGDPGSALPARLLDLLGGWGLGAQGSPVVDLDQGLASDPRTFLAADIPIHPATAGVPGILVSNAVALTVHGGDAAVLASSSKTSFVDATGDGVYTAGTADRRGPLPVVAVGERLLADPTPTSLPKSRVALVGDGRAFTNGRFLDAGNRLLAVKLVDWLTASPEVVSIAWRPPEANRLVLTRAEERYVLFVCVVAVPVALASLGALCWLRRRRSP
jgi:hypothetical protein